MHHSFEPGTRLGHYALGPMLGAGGMGQVFRATDTRLGRDVALKVLPAAMAGDPDRLERFRLEARAVAALNHPRIVTLYSVEEVEGVHFLTMELVDGTPLNQLIPEGGLSLDRLHAVATSLAEALAAAHDKGIVHRDLKPANVMVTADGGVKVLDFGLSKTVSSGSPSGATMTAAQPTGAGVVMGTPAYMSPEQITGRVVDHATDLFSFGVILYEMATGRRPFEGASPAELASSILRDMPPRPTAMRRDLPSGVVLATERCLRKDPAARPKTAREVHALLSSSAVATAPTDTKSIAVLPFVSLNASADDEFLADGVTEEILNVLAQVPGLRVAGRSSAFSFKGRHEDLRSIGSKLGVAHILEGTLRRAGARLRITAQLIDAASGYQLWSERYDRQMEDVFALQDEIARAIADRLKVSFGPGAAPGSPPTKHLGAYELYLKGRALLYRRGLSILPAIDCFTEAVTLDPDYAQAWAGLADGYTTAGYSAFMSVAEVMPKALSSARRALALDPTLSEAHCAFACATMLFERNYAEAVRGFERALQLNPQYIQARAWYGLFYLHWVAGRPEAGREHLHEVLRLDPLSGYAQCMMGFSYLTSGCPHDGVAHSRRGMDLDPQSYLVHWTLLEGLRYAGLYDDALAIAERALAMSGRHAWALQGLVSIHAASGRMADARAAYAEMQARSTRENVQPAILSIAAASVQEVDSAIAYAQRALDERDPLFVLLARCWPGYGPLRADDRFAAIIAQLGLPD